MAASSGIITSGYLSDLDWVTPLWSKELYKPFGTQQIEIFLELLAQPSGSVIVGNENGQWLEEDRFDTFIGVNAPVSASGNNAITFVVPTAELVNGVPYCVAGNILLDVANKVRWVVKEVNGANVTIVPLIAGSAVNLTTSTKFAVFTDTRPEGSDGPDYQKSGVTAYTWQTQIIRTAINMTGTALTNEIKTTVTGLNGGKGGVRGEFTKQMEWRNLKYCVGALLFGAKQTNTNPDVEALSLGTTDGLDYSVETRGQNIDTAGADIDETTFYSLTDLLVTQNAPNAYTVWASKKRMDEIEINMKAQFDNTNLGATQQVYAQYAFGDSSKIAGLEATFAFNKITIGGKMFFLRQLPILNDPMTYNIAGVTNNPYQDLAFFIPMGATNVQDAKGNSVLAPYVQVKNHSYGGVDRYMRIWETGAMSDSNKTRKDELVIDCVTDFGYQFAAMNTFAAIR